MSPATLNLGLARGLHTLIYGVMSASTLALLYIGVTGRLMGGLWVVVPLLTIEIAVFVSSGLKCPLTAVVDRCAGGSGRVADTFLPEGLTRHSLVIFGPVLPVAFMLLAARWAGMIGPGA